MRGKVLIAGIDGFIGFALAQNLVARGFEVYGIDNLFRRKVATSITPIASVEDRVHALSIGFEVCDVTDWPHFLDVLHRVDPDAIVYLAHQPSAPYSMKDRDSCFETTFTNTIGPLNLVWALRELKMDVHVIVIGTLGEYAASNIPISEKGLEISYGPFKEVLPYPRRGISFYHDTKILGSLYLELACNCWGLTVTDVMQGVVFGVLTEEIDGKDELLFTRFDADELFGTYLNRLCAEAATKDVSLTVYGSGNQKRGFLPLRDSIQCLRLLLENPPKRGEYRLVNQLMEVYRLEDLARTVKRISMEEFGIFTKMKYYPNPRVEREDIDLYKVEKGILDSLGYKPSITLEEEIKNTIEICIKYRKRIPRKLLKPRTRWRA